jgi:hypothetical protein
MDKKVHDPFINDFIKLLKYQNKKTYLEKLFHYIDNRFHISTKGLYVKMPKGRIIENDRIRK